MPKFDSPINIKTLKGRNSNSALLHLGDDNRVGIGIEAPETKLHVDGAITATGLVVPAGILSTSVDTAEFWGFNPKFDTWYFDELNFPVANGYIQTSGTDKVEKSSDSVLGSYSARWAKSIGSVWQREVEFPEPLYANVFIQGTYSYKFEYYGSGEPGLAITLTHREKKNSDLSLVAGKTWASEYSNTFISPTFPLHAIGNWQTATWRAHTPPNREITKLKIEIIASSALGQTYDSADAGIELTGGGGDVTTSIGGDDNYDWSLDGLAFNFMHPDARIDQEGRITGAYIAYASIDDAHIKNMISSPSARVIASSGDLAGLYVDGLVANDDYAAGWSISKDGIIKGTDIKIYGPDGRVKISGGRINPFADWAGRSLADLDSSASSYLYGLAFEESNATGLMANVEFLATSGTDSDAIVSSVQSLYIANTVDGTASIGSALANGTIQYNGISSNAPPGSIFTGGKNVVKNQDAYILFLANTQKWDSEIGAQQKYHANTLLGEYGLYVLGTPTVGGWIYHPHANNTWHSIDSLQSGNRLHEGDFLVIGKIKTDISGNILSGVMQPPKSTDSITAPEALTSAPAINIPAGGILFADINLNQWNHTANSGEVQLTNSRNNPNTEFTFIHPGTNDPNDSTLHTVNGAYGVLTSLEDFPGTRYITFVGTDTTRFTLQTGHSPDFVAAFPLGTPPRWYYNQDEGKFSTFTPTDRDCIVARVDANGSVGALTNIYRYAEREATTSEGGVISDVIINPPLGMASGGTLFADLRSNREFKISDNTTPSNTGFVSLVNTENNPRNRFFVIHPDNGYFWEVANTGRGVVTNLNNGVRIGGSNTGTRHVAFVGGTWPHEENRFPMAAGYENVSNDFIAVTKYHSDTGKIHPTSGVWYYDNGQNATTTFTINANDFIIATLSSFNAQTDGIDQVTRWAARAAQIEINGEMVTVDSIRNDLLGGIARVLTYAETAANTAMDQAILAYDLAANASANATKSLGLLDNQNVIYFTEEGSAAPTSGTYGNAQSDVAWTYNDIWINTSIYGRHLDGSWSTNAIFRYANSAGGFDDSSVTESVPSGEGTVGLAWRHDRTNPTGRSYLVSLEGRDLADRAQINFYVPRSAEVYPFYGPNVAVLSTGELNRNPEGDQWYDIFGNPPDNHLYIYRTNSTFSNTSHGGGYIATGTGAWAQTVHNTANFGIWDEATKPTGWWDFQDAASGDATAAIGSERNARIAADVILEDHAANALSRAADAQAAADREILAFFEIGAPTATSNGDVWIKTDSAIDSTGTKNLNSIFVSNTTSGIPGIGAGSDLFWNYGPNNAIGLMYLESYSSGVSGEFARGTNIMPRGYSVFDAPLSDYGITAGGNAPPDIAPEPYGISPRPDNEPAGFPDAATANVAIERGFNSNSYLHNSSLRIEVPGGGGGQAAPHIIFAGGNEWNSEGKAGYNQKYRIDIPKGKKFIFSYYVRANTTTAKVYPAFYSSNSTHYNSGVPFFNVYSGGAEQKSVSVIDTWERHEWVFDFNSSGKFNGMTNYDPPITTSSPMNEITSITPILELRGFDATDFYFDAIQLEEVPNTVFTASQFKEPSDGSAIVFGRKITDGKIVTYYYDSRDNGGQHGPIPNTTPTGLPNPQPHGDFWIDTGNNNIIFRYHQNDFNAIPTAQNIFWTSVTNGDGWYTTEDLRTGNALSTSYDALANAATAQAAADREIFAYFQTGSVDNLSPPVASGNGDIWIDTDSFATLNTSSIYVARSAGADAITTGEWEQSPDSAIGQVYLEAWTAGETASRADSLAISAFGTSNLPFPVYPDANGIMGVGATGNVVFYKNSTQEVEPGTTATGPGEFSAYNRGGVDFVGPTGKLWYPESGGYGIPETGAIHTKLEGLGGTGETTEARYIMYTNQSASVRFAPGMTSMGSHDHFVTVEWEPVSESWQVYDNSSGVFKFTPDAANGDFLVGKITRPTPVPEGLKTLESWVFKTLPVQTQNFTDGKIVTHFGTHYTVSGPDKGTWGPIPNTTPTGLANPQPDGDFWIDTSNNNIVFRYHQNDIDAAVPSAQVAFHYVATSASPDGWYSTEDARTGNALSTSYSAVQDAAAAQAAADHEILTFFSVESSVPTSSGNGDIWIVTDFALRPGTTEANTNSIRVANTYNPAGSLTAGENRYWHISPNNAVGITYLLGYANNDYTRALADGKIVNHYGPNYGSNPYFGPDPEFTPKDRLDNPSPHGDRWVNTSNNNIEFVYNQNNSNYTAQTIVWHPPSSFTFDLTTDKSAWYSTEDERTANALASSYNANAAALVAQGRADDAYSSAGVAQAAADKEILAFFALLSNVPAASGNGDIWVVTDYPVNLDGTPNVASLYISNTLSTSPPAIQDSVTATQYWNPAPNNAIGLSYLESFAAGVSGAYRTGDNIMPRGYSTFDDPADYHIFHTTPTGQEPYPIMVVGDGGIAENGLANVTIDTTRSPSEISGGSSLRVRAPLDLLGLELSFANGEYGHSTVHNGDWAIKIPTGRRWVFSYYVSGDNDLLSQSTYNPYIMELRLKDTQNPNANVAYLRTNSTKPAHPFIDKANVWKRQHAVLDFTDAEHDMGWRDLTVPWSSDNKGHSHPTLGSGSPDGGWLVYGGNGDIGDLPQEPLYAANVDSMIIHLGPRWNGSIPEGQPSSRRAAGNTMWFSGFQLEEVASDISTPSEFKRPTDRTDIIFGRQITDGKILTRYETHYPDDLSGTHWGPNPAITPKQSLPNPEPHGDSWHNTSNNNLIFRYHQNTSDNSAQTMFWTASTNPEAPSGWYSTEDPRTIIGVNANTTAHEALANAATAQAAADREIQSFFAVHTPAQIASGNGDVWIQIDNVLKSDGTANTGSIFVWNDAIPEWQQRPESAIGRGFLKTFTEGIGSNWMSKAFSTFDEDPNDYNHWMNYQIHPVSSGTGSYPDWNNEHPGAPYQFYGWQQNVHTTNSTYGYGDSGSLVITTNTVLGGTFGGGSFDTEPTDWYKTHWYIGDTSFNGPTYWTDPYNYVKVPKGRKWIYSFYVRTDFATPTTVNGGRFLSQQFIVRNSENKEANAVYYWNFSMAPVGKGIAADDWIPITDDAASGWERVSGVLDLSLDEFMPGQQLDKDNHTTAGIFVNDGATVDKIKSNEVDEIRFHNGTGSLVGNTIWISAAQLEEVPGDRITPSSFQAPSSKSQLDFSRAIADGKIVTHYEINSGFPDYLGPDPSTLPKSSQPNVTPFGDLWVDVANNNIVFRYHQNTTNYTSRKTYHANTAPHNHADESGWYSTEDLRTPDAAAIIGDGSTPGTLVYDTRKALADAASAASAADAELLVFFETSSNTDMINDRFLYGSDTGPATGNGDIWIHTDFATNQDGTPNNYAIYFANLSTDAAGPGVVRIGSTGWTQSPYNAIGRGFIEQFASVGVKNWMHSPYSLFDEDPEEYDGRDSGFTTTKPYPIATFSAAGSTISIDTSGGANAHIGSTSLKLGVAATGGPTGSKYFGFANSFAENIFPSKYSIKIQKGKRWILSAWYKGEFFNGTFNGRLYLEGANSTHGYSGQINNDGQIDNFTLASELEPSVYPSNTWRRASVVLDLSSGMSSDSQTEYEGELNQWDEVIPGIALGTANEIRTAWFDGFQLEEAPGARILPGQFSDPDKQISDDFARALADGKILTHYEPAIDNLKAWWMMDAANTSGWIANEVNPGTYDANSAMGSPGFADDTIFGGGKSLVNEIGTGAVLLDNSYVSAIPESTYTIWVKPTGDTATTFSPFLIGRSHTGHWSVHSEFNHTFVDDGATYNEINFWASGNKRTIKEPGYPDNGKGVLLDGKWNFIATTVNHTTRELNIYVYNEKDGFVTQNTHSVLLNSDPSASVGPTSGEVNLGVSPSYQAGLSGAQRTWPSANFDHVRFYDKVLSKPDIDALFNIRTRTRKQPDAELYPYWYSNNVVYGPDPEFTPQKRLPNPAPHGDYWYDSSDFNRPFRYNQNTSNKVAQTAYYSTIAYQEDKLGYEPSGWFTSGDGTAEISADSIGNVGRDVAESLERIRQLNPLIDQELKIFFETEGTTHFVNALGTHTTAAYGDIWINTSDYNANGYTGGLVSNAIFRWQNSLGFFTDHTGTEASTGATLGMAWRHAEDNAFGQIYLSASYASNASDRLVAVYSMPGTAEASAWYGPNVAFTMTGIRNPNPDGDLWYDTGNNNIAHVFNKVGGTWPEFAQTVHSDASSMVSEGWYRLEDLRTSSFNAAFELAAATGTDRHAQIFTSMTAPTTSTGNGDIWIDSDAMLNSDGTTNYNAIYIANSNPDITGFDAGSTNPPSRDWHSEPTSGLGRSHIERLLAETGSNWLPRGHSTFDVANTDYYIYGAGTYDGPIADSGLASRPYRIYYSNTKEAPEIISSPAGANTYIGGKSLLVKLDQDLVPGAPKAFSRIFIGAGTGDKKWMAKIRTGRKWVYSWWQNSSNTTVNPAPPLLRMYVSNGDFWNTRDVNNPKIGKMDFNSSPGLVSQTTSNPWEWKRYYIYFDLTGDHYISRQPTPGAPDGLPGIDGHSDIVDDDVHDVNDEAPVTAGLTIKANEIDRFQMFYNWTEGLTQGANQRRQHIHMDGFQLEDVTNSIRRTPSAFQEPSPKSEIDFSRAISDGKTVYFVSNTFHGATEDHAYGPNPSTTDNDLTNPEPYGDKWISLSPPYKTYLYFSNATNKTAQTAFHTPTTYALGNYKNTQWPFGTSNNSTGWYEYRDTGDALSQEGLEVRLHMDSIYRVALGEARWTENSLTNLINSLITLREDAEDPPQVPTLDLGDITSFGETRELFLNSVPPRDANLMGHWAFNSFGVDDNGVRYLPDATGRGNHARVVGYTANQAAFSEHDPADGFVNVSGNLSLNNSVGSSSHHGADNDGHIVIAQHGEDGSTDLQIDGQPYTALNIADTATFNKGTFCFWFKPGTPVGITNTIFGRNHDSWGMLRTSSFSGWDANNEFSLHWYSPKWPGNSGPGPRELQIIDITAAGDGWVHPPVNNVSKGLRYNEWHFVVWQWDFDSAVSGDKYTRLWIYRDGAGLLYTGLKPAPDGMTASVDACLTGDADDLSALCLGVGMGIGPLGIGNPTNQRGVGNYDEARLYSEVLSARNLRWLFETPSGRPFAAPNRPGVGVKKNHISFFEGNWAGTTGPAGDLSGTAANTFAYFHGFDVDGNPADVDPYISFNGQVKYLTRDFMKMYFATDAESNKYAGNTGYVMYNDEAPWSDNFNNDDFPKQSADVRYVFAMPIGANSTQPHTWQYHNYNGGDDAGFIKFTPDESKHLVIGEARLANAVEMTIGIIGTATQQRKIQSVEIYQMARKPSVVRQSYNFNIRPEDFATFKDHHFFSNSLFWTTDKMNGTFIADATIGNAQIQSLAADKIEAGTIEAKVTVGGEASIIIDGVNNRIIIKD